MKSEARTLPCWRLPAIRWRSSQCEAMRSGRTLRGANAPRRPSALARQDDGEAAGVLVAVEVVVRDAATPAEVACFGHRVGALHRHHEAHAVGRGDLAIAPDPRHGQRGLRVHQAGVGGEDGLADEVVGAHPFEPFEPQRRALRARDRTQTEVAGLREQGGTEAPAQPGTAGTAPARLDHRVGEGDPGVDLEQQLREVDRGHGNRDAALERGDARRLLAPLELRIEGLARPGRQTSRVPPGWSKAASALR